MPWGAADARTHKAQLVVVAFISPRILVVKIAPVRASDRIDDPKGRSPSICRWRMQRRRQLSGEQSPVRPAWRRLSLH